MEKKKHIILIAGEASGDLHGAHLVEELKQLDPALTFSGLGGTKMQNAGVELYYDMTKLAVVGFAEVIKHYNEFKEIFHLTLNKIKSERPLAVIFIDYPGFNLRLAKEVKKLGIKTIYYISPQVWAWKKSRIKFIKKYIDQMIVIFKFEEDFYAQHGVKTTYVGHPLIDTMKNLTPKDKTLKAVGLVDYKMTLGLLPGSRVKEIERHMPVMLETVESMSKKYPMMQFLLIKAPTIERKLLDQYIYDSPAHIKISDQDNYSAINACDICIVASGTATLEVALLEKPMIIIYKTSLMTWLLAKLFVEIPDIGLVNVISQKRIVPECIQFKANAVKIIKELEHIFTNEVRIAEIKAELRKVRKVLDTGGASERAASEIFKTIQH
jgi:lipid-A-disaccharide synthase